MIRLIRASGIIDGTGTGFLPGVAVLVHQGRILEVAPEDELRNRADEMLDLGSAVLLPGFIDAHTHITIRPGDGDQHGQISKNIIWQALRGVENVNRMLRAGVTTARIMGEKAGLDYEFKNAIAVNEILGPRLLVSGMSLSASHGHGTSLGTADGIDEIRSIVRKNIRHGADHIKIFVTGGVSSSGSDIFGYHYSREEIRTVVEEAHRAGLKVAAHAHGGIGVNLCAEEGVDSVEHGGLLSDENISKMIEAGTWLVLTNTIAFHPGGIEQGDADNPAIIAKLKQVRATIEKTFERIKATGLRFTLGTDSMHGLFGYEMEWLVNHGVTPETAIMAATCHGAEAIGKESDVGTLESGKLADMVALKNSPLDDIRAVYKVVSVIKEGRMLVDKRNGQ